MLRIVLLRHGETEGESSIRYHGSNDVALSEAGRAQVRAAAAALGGQRFDLVVSSPMQRARACAPILAPRKPISLEHDFREVSFGRWEGLTAEEIEAMDPVLYREWREAPEDFAFPDGDDRREFRARVHRGLDRVLTSGVRSVLVLGHMGVVRTITERLTGEPLARNAPALGSLVRLSRLDAERWVAGR